MPDANGLNGHTNGHIPAPVENAEISGMRSRYSPEMWSQFLDIAHNASMVRRDFMKSLTDPRRDLEDSCGYPRLDTEVAIDMYKQLYDRDAIAARVVEVLPMESWQVHPTVYETEDPEDVTKFEEAWDGLGNNLASSGSTWFEMEEGSGLWDYLRRADILSGIGKFGVIFLGIDDGKNPQDPADGVAIVGREITPIMKEVDDTSSPNGKPSNGKPPPNGKAPPFGKSQTPPNGQVPPKGAPPNGQTPTDEQTPPDEEQDTQQPPTPPKKKVRIGTKITNKYADYNPFMQDSPMTKGEEESLLKLKNLTPEERIIINQWKQQRVEYIRNATQVGQTEKVNPVEPSSRLSSSSPQRERMVGGDKDVRTPKGSMQTGQEQVKSPSQAGATIRATDAGGAEEVTGTDQQYLGGLGMPPSAFASMSGTDQQYYGVQFGPTEYPDAQPSKQSHKLLFIRCFDESLLQVVRYEWNIRNPRFGMPVMYRVTLNDPREMHSGIGLPMATIFVHWSRLVHVADVGFSAGSSEIFAKPRQQQVLNNILGIRKLSCGSPEMYWRGAFPGLALSTHPQLGGDVEVNRSEVRDSMENYFNDLQRYLLLTGMSANTLSPTVVDPTGHIDVQIQLICIKLACPKRVFMGSERGELASSQDDSQWNDVKRSRQNFYVTPRIIVPFVDRCIQLGLLPEPESYSIKWPDLEALSDKDKAAIALQNMQMLQTYVSGNVATVLPAENLYVDFLGKDQDEMKEIMQALQDQQDQMAQQQQAAIADGSQFGAPPQSPEDQQALEDMGNEFGGQPPDEGDQGPPGQQPPGGPPQPGQPQDEGQPSDEDTSQPDTGEETQPQDQEDVAPPDERQPPPPKGKKPFPPTKNRSEMSEWESDVETLATLNSFLSGGDEWYDDEDIENKFCATGKGGGVDATCKADEGNIQSEGPKGTTEYEGKTFKGKGTQDNPIHVGSNVDAAVKLLGEGKHVSLAEVKHLGEMVTKIGEVNKQAQADGKTPLHYDMCKTSVGGTGFCEENIGTPRAEMPQMRGFPVPGTLASTKVPNKAGKVDLSREFIDHLKEQGVKVKQDEIRASQLKASQSEIVGSRVNELVEKAHTGEDLRKRPIFVTKDGYVLDGHHHWAAIVAYGAEKGKDFKVPVHVVDMDIKSAIKVANDFAKKSGIAPKSGSATKNTYEESDEDFERRMIRGILRNAFCPTGEGGGIDATCSPHEIGGGKSESSRDFMPGDYKSPKGAPPNEKLPNNARPKVDIEQANAIENYTRIDNRALNRALYKDQPIPTDVLETHHNLQAAFAQAKVFDKPVEVYRGVQCKPDNFQRMVDAAKSSMESGKAFSIKGYQSTTTNPHATFNGNVQMKINAVHGLDARPYSNSPHEDELLLNKESNFTVKSMKVVNGTLHLELDQHPPQEHSKDREYIQKYKEAAKSEKAEREKAPSQRKSGRYFFGLFGGKK